jgi:hypothetical protein
MTLSGWLVVKLAEEDILKGSIPDHLTNSTVQNLQYIKTTNQGNIKYIADIKKLSVIKIRMLSYQV